MAPLLSFHKTFDTHIAIGDLQIPIHVARLAKSQLEELDEGWNRLVVMPRGSAPQPDANATPEEQLAFVVAEADRLQAFNKGLEKERYEFFERVITAYITLDEGLIEDCGVSVTDGQGLLKLFHGRRDVLRDLLAAVITQNHLVELMRKNSNSPRASGPGSDRLSQARGGDAPEPTAASAASSTSAAPAPATDASDETDEGSPSSSGAPHEEPKVH